MIDKYVVKLILEIEELALNISTNTDHDIFFNYSGHVKKIEVGYCEYGWTKDKKIISILDIFLEINEEPEKELIKAKEFLKTLLS